MAKNAEQLFIEQLDQQPTDPSVPHDQETKLSEVKITQEMVYEILSELSTDDSLDYEQLELVSMLEDVLDRTQLDDTLLEGLYHRLVRTFDDELEDSEIDFSLGEKEYDVAVGEEEEIEPGTELKEEDLLNEKIRKMVRGGKVIRRKKGYRKVKGRYVKIKRSTLLKQKRAARKRRRKPIKSSVKAKMKRSRRKTFRTKGSFIRRNRGKAG